MKTPLMLKLAIITVVVLIVPLACSVWSWMVRPQLIEKFQAFGPFQFSPQLQVAIVVVAAALCVIGLGIIAAYFLSTSKDDHA